MILDTNAISALSSRDPSLIEMMGNLTSVSTTLINLGEYHFGILKSSHKKELEQWLEVLLKHIEVLQPNLQTLPHYAKIRDELKTAGTPILTSHPKASAHTVPSLQNPGYSQSRVLHPSRLPLRRSWHQHALFWVYPTD
jgi:predicted nucleic acid-binding protein